MSRRRSGNTIDLWAFLSSNAGKTLLVLLGLALVVSWLTGPLGHYPNVQTLVWIVLYGVGLWGLYTLRTRFGQRRRIKALYFNELLALTPAEFEFAVADLLSTTGYRRLERVGKAGDLCADLKGYGPDGASVVVQCKRYAPGNKIGTPEIQTFIGMIAVHHRSDSGIFVTTSFFTQPAIDLARSHHLTLIDGERLGALLPETKPAWLQAAFAQQAVATAKPDYTYQPRPSKP
jgi:restriction system protein